MQVILNILMLNKFLEFLDRQLSSREYKEKD